MALNQGRDQVGLSTDPKLPVPSKYGSSPGDNSNYVEAGNIEGANNRDKAYSPDGGNSASWDQVLNNRNDQDPEHITSLNMYQSEALESNLFGNGNNNVKNVFNEAARIDIYGNHSDFPGQDNNPSPTSWKLFGINMLDRGRGDPADVVPIVRP